MNFWIFGDTDQKPYWILLMIIITLACAPHVSAYQYDFQESDGLDDWTLINGGPWGTSSSIGANSNSLGLDTYQVKIGTNWGSPGANGFGGIKSVSYPTNYWAWTTTYASGYGSGSGWMSGPAIIWYDISGTSIGMPIINTQAGSRYEVIREGNNYNLYINGVFSSIILNSATVPYFFGIGTGCSGNGGNTVTHHIDDIIIGTSEDQNIISCPPQTWFAVKDIVDPGFSGLYSAPNTQVYASAMHCSYATDDGSATIKVKHMATNTVVNTTTVSSYAGIITYNLTEMLFESGAPYGIYWVYDYDNPMASDQFEYRSIATSGTSIMWNQSTYEAGESALLNFSIAETYWDTDDYSYAVVIWDSEFNNVYEVAIPARPVEAELTVAIDDFVEEAGAYYAVILATDLSSAEELMFAYDDMYADILGASDVIVTGTTYDATTGNLLGSAVVTATQLGSGHSDTSDAGTAVYEITGLVTDWSIGVNATKAGYAGYLTAFTPYVGGTYGIDVPMVPTGGPDPGAYFDVDGGQITTLTHNNVTTSYYNLTEDGTAIGGIVYLSPYWSLGEGVNCTLWNATWSDTNFTNVAGWYQINNIPLDTETGEYVMTYSKDGYSTVNSSVLIYNQSFNRVDAYMEGTYNLTVNVRDLTTHALVTGTTVEISLDTGEDDETTTGTYTFTNLSYGSYTVTAVADGYYPGSSGAVLDADKTVTVYIQSTTEQPSTGVFDLTVYVRDINTLALITASASISLDTGETATTTTGSHLFEDLAYGSYSANAVVSGYYPGSVGVALDADKSVTIYMQSTSGTPPGSFNLTVYVKDINTLALITDSASLALDTGETAVTTTGTYTFTNLPYGSYSVNSVISGYYPGSVGVALDANKTATIYMQSTSGTPIGEFNLTVYVKDTDTLALITSSASISLDTGETAVTATGSYLFENLSYGSYAVNVVVSGYYPGAAGVALDADKSVTVYMTAKSGNLSSQMQYSTSLDTRFLVQNKYGKPLPGTTVTLTPTDTTLAQWSWLQSLLGIPETVMLNNTTLSGVTDTMGGINFVVAKEIYYKIDFVNAGEGVSETTYLYPKDDFYVFTVDTTDTTVANNTVSAGIAWTLTNTTINATHENLTFTYSDPSGLTTNLSFWVKTQASPVTCCHQEYVATPCDASCSYTAASTSGTGLIWGFDAVNGEVGNFTDSAAISFTKLVDLGIPTYYYGWIAAAFVIVLGGFFSVINVRFGAVLVPCVAYLFWWMKWLTMGPTTAVILGVLLIIAVISYIRKQENKE